MTKTLSRLAAFAAGLLLAGAAYASEGGNLQSAGARLDDRASLQLGAQLVINY